MIVLAGVDHHRATVAVRERFAVEPVTEALARAPFDETLILSTCNRHEVYAVTDDPAQVARRLPGADLNLAAGLDVAEHAFRVAAGLESVVLGEPQILTQVRQAFKAARAAGTLGPMLTALFQRAINVGKRARAETRIASCAPGLVEAGLEIARRERGPLAGRTVLVVGAGKMSDLAASSIASHGARILVANRTPARADALTRRIPGARVVALAEGVHRADLIVTCTAAPGPIITADMLTHDAFVIDLAVPRDVEPLARARVVDLDELARAITPSGRAADEIVAVERLIADQVARFDAWLRARLCRASAA